MFYVVCFNICIPSGYYSTNPRRPVSCLTTCHYELYYLLLFSIDNFNIQKVFGYEQMAPLAIRSLRRIIHKDGAICLKE